MEVQEIHDPITWNTYLLSQPTQAGIFLQSWEWLEFQKTLGRKVWRLGIMEHGAHSMEHLIGVCGVAKYELPMWKSYLYALRGPVWQNEELRMKNEELVDCIKKIAKQERAIFCRFEPIHDFDTRSYTLHATRPIQPKQTLVCDLAPSDEDLLSQMHEKTRYNIRLALKKGVKCQVTGISEFEKFWKMFQETAKRDGFTTHDRKYYETMLAVLGDKSDMRVRLYLAYHDDTLLAGAIVGYFGDTATYLFGASSYEHRAYMGPYGLHWNIMREAKQMGYRFYDFWGTDTKGAAAAHGRNWSGITRFKMGFGGKLMEYPGTFDLPLSRFWYTVYRLRRKMF